MTGRGADRAMEAVAVGASDVVLRSIVESLPARIFWKDRESRYLGCNTAFARDAGFESPDNVVGKTDFEMPWAAEAGTYREHDRAVLSSGIPELDCEEPQTTPAGGTRWLSTSKVPLRAADGSIIGVIGIYEDISARKSAEVALKESDERTRSILDAAMDGFWLATTEGRLVEVNEAYCQMSGYSREELLALEILDLDVTIGPEPADSPIVRKVLEDGEHRFETRHRRKDGTIFDVEVSVQYRPEAAAPLVMFLRDITERTRVAEALRGSEERHRTIIQTAMDGFWLTDRKGKLLEVNDAYCRMSGYSAQELLGMPIAALKDPTFQDDSPEHIRRAMEQGEARFESRHRRKDGTIFDLEVSIQYRMRDGGQFVAFQRDITERKRSEDALRMSEERYRSILTASPDTFTITDLAGRILMLSPVGLATMGYSEETVAGRSIFEFIVEEDRARAEADVALMFEGILKGPEDYRGVRADGSLIDLEVNAEFIRGADGEPQQLVFICRDITERKRAAEALQKTHDMITKLTAQVPGVVYQYRLYPDGRSCFPFASSGMRTIYEVTPEEVREDATPVFGRLHPDDRAAVSADILESGRTLEPFHCEFRVVLPEQGLRWRLCDAMPSRTDDGGTLWYGIISDITDRKHADELLRLSLKEKESLLREVHHRVKNNLQVISSLLRLESSRSDAADTRRVLQDMQGRILSMAVLHETLYRSGLFGQVDLAGYLKQLAQQLFRATSTAAELNLNLSPVTVEIDQAIPCGLILNELLTNSLKHAFVGRDAGQIRVALAQSGSKEVQFSVSDTGVGLPPDFETRRERSLGLQLVTDLVHQIGGRLRIEPGPGASFVVTFTPNAAHAAPPGPRLTGEYRRP